MTTYETLANFAQTWGFFSFILLFGAVLIYALKPSNQRAFDEAARIPLEKD